MLTWRPADDGVYQDIPRSCGCPSIATPGENGVLARCAHGHVVGCQLFLARLARQAAQACRVVCGCTSRIALSPGHGRLPSQPHAPPAPFIAAAAAATLQQPAHHRCATASAVLSLHPMLIQHAFYRQQPRTAQVQAQSAPPPRALPLRAPSRRHPMQMRSPPAQGGAAASYAVEDAGHPVQAQYSKETPGNKWSRGPDPFITASRVHTMTTQAPVSQKPVQFDCQCHWGTQPLHRAAHAPAPADAAAQKVGGGGAPVGAAVG
jgi:hypothetical protein